MVLIQFSEQPDAEFHQGHSHHFPALLIVTCYDALTDIHTYGRLWLAHREEKNFRRLVVIPACVRRLLQNLDHRFHSVSLLDEGLRVRYAVRINPSSTLTSR